MPQAIDRLLATPNIRPRLPRISPADSGMSSSFCRSRTGRLLCHRGPGPSMQPTEAAGSLQPHPTSLSLGHPPRSRGGIPARLLHVATGVVGLLVAPLLHQFIEVGVTRLGEHDA